MTVGLIYTGGTAGQRPATREREGEARGLRSFLELLRGRLPPRYWPKVVGAEAVSVKMSENRIPLDWVALARAIDRGVREQMVGIVLVHGTDTLIHTACALKELLRGVPIPVVLTGARIPLVSRGTDAVQNLAHAFRVAQEGERPGVWIVFAGAEDRAGLILRPENTRKMTERIDCFQPVEGVPAGLVRGNVLKGEPVRVYWNTKGRIRGKPYQPHFEVRTDVSLFKLYPGFRADWIEAAAHRGYRAILLEGYGSGTVCTEGGEWDVTAAVQSVVRRGVAVRLLSQHGGRLAIRYESTRALLRAGARLAEGRTVEAELARWMCRLDRAGANVYKPRG